MNDKNYVHRFQPNVVKDNDTMNNLYDVQADEIEKFNNETQNTINNLFIKSADLKGVQRQEKFFNINPNPQHTLEERKMIVLNKILYRPPFTRQRLTEILENIWGKGHYIYQLYPNDYRLIIDIDTNNPVIYLQFSKQLREIIPANIYLILSIQYTYIYLKRNFTYNSLSELTYEELSRYSIIEETI